MIPTVEISAVYGPTMTFRLAVDAEDGYEFALGGNTLPLFPHVEMGRWQGRDAEGTALVRAAIASCDEANNPSSLPDSAYVQVTHREAAQAERVRLYSLYEPPSAWAAAQATVLSQVNGPWLVSRLHVLRAQVKWLKPTLSRVDAPMAAIDYESAGTAAVSFSSPVRAELWSATVAPQGMSPDDLDGYPYDLDAGEFVVSSPAAASGKHATLDAGRRLLVLVTIKRKLPPGKYDVTLRYLSEEVRNDPARASGILTLTPGVLEVQP